MRKNKNKMSLTAKQRKAQRNKALGIAETLTDEERAVCEQEQQQQAEQKKKKRKFITVLVSSILAGVLALGSIAAAILVNIDWTDYDNEKINPYATITLSNNEKIEIELLWKEQKDSRAIISNFIYLSENKFFNNTMFVNSASSFLVMSGFTSPTTYKGQDENFMSTLHGFAATRSNKWDTSEYKLGYRLSTKAHTPPSKEGYIAFMSAGDSNFGTSTSFVLIGDPSAQLTNSNNTAYALSYFGRMTAASIEAVKRINEMTRHSASFKGADNWYYPESYQNVMIKSVTIKKLNKQTRKNILNHFEKFVINGSSTFNGALKGQYGSNWQKHAGGYIVKAIA